MNRERKMVITKRPWLSLGAGVVVGVATCLLVALLGPGGEDALWSGVRLTGRISFLFFLVPLTARPLHILLASHWTKRMLAYRGNFGLLFAGNHLAHLAFILALYEASDTPPVSEAVRWGGSLAMFELALMTILSFQAAIRIVGVRPTAIIHRISMYGVISAFFYDIILKNPLGSYPVLTSLLVGGLALRFVAWVVEGRRAVAKEPIEVRVAH